MGARKRASRREAVLIGSHLWHQGANSAMVCAAAEDAAYTEARIEYRVGQRLRPCSGCEECLGYDVGMGMWHCDGSGVLPARKKG